MVVGNGGKKKVVFNSAGTWVKSGVSGGGRSPGVYPSLTAPTGPAQTMDGPMSMWRLSLGGKGVFPTPKLFEKGAV